MSLQIFNIGGQINKHASVNNIYSSVVYNIHCCPLIYDVATIENSKKRLQTFLEPCGCYAPKEKDTHVSTNRQMSLSNSQHNTPPHPQISLAVNGWAPSTNPTIHIDPLTIIPFDILISTLNGVILSHPVMFEGWSFLTTPRHHQTHSPLWSVPILAEWVLRNWGVAPPASKRSMTDFA